MTYSKYASLPIFQITDIYIPKYFFCKYIHVIYKKHPHPKQIHMSCTQTFVLYGDRTLDLQRSRRVFVPPVLPDLNNNLYETYIKPLNLLLVDNHSYRKFTEKYKYFLMSIRTFNITVWA
jgi:hypothetical protein